jgi:hypothetical protein
MASYVVTGKNTSGDNVLAIDIAAINQDPQVVSELSVVDALRTWLAGQPGIGAVTAQKYEQVITNV